MEVSKNWEDYCITNKNKKQDEWLFIHEDTIGKLSVNYLLPTLQKYNHNYVDKKLLLNGEVQCSLGKTIQNGKIYYQMRY